MLSKSLKKRAFTVWGNVILTLIQCLVEVLLNVDATGDSDGISVGRQQGEVGCAATPLLLVLGADAAAGGADVGGTVVFAMVEGSTVVNLGPDTSSEVIRGQVLYQLQVDKTILHCNSLRV